MLGKIYWKIKSSGEKRYFTKKYSKLIPKIYYDKKYDCHINPKIIEERGCVEYICGEITRSGVIYHYFLGSQVDHAHTLGDVLIEAYNHAETFSIAPEHEGEYSSQELKFIDKLVAQGKLDRRNYCNRI